ncbi:phytanoyl-CoA dioxygenase family protein [Phenylobacterium kunshanense]|uniref:Phytanoyl-CoA dioxygenase family protein n=1 Tax=Phenylobacterium kunshanense TaxID=1445034 RepID=A0A328B8N2_9CAUL|nr:phytanoyl-CoA dioxygenase family protein [Phenylobacterium kunshanense]RAK63712.1 phytanoyl-CoA dioxygenase family protein [Phenylobacterium kunshanense]
MDQAVTGFDADAHAAEIRERGYTVIRDFMDADAITRFREGLAPFVGRRHGRNDFEGFKTERVYTLVARGRVFEDLTEDPRLLAILDRFLQPGYLLTASQSIQINPGETAQDLHTDDGFYRQPRPRPPLSMTVIGAIDDFTPENGCTEVIPGSHLWGDPGAEGRPNDPAEWERMLVPMEMPAGACFVMAGTCIHRGGANRSDGPRLGFTNQYCQPWCRTQENFFLGVPAERTRAMSPRLQSLLGYNIWPPFMGMVSSLHPLKALEPGWVPPVATEPS